MTLTSTIHDLFNSHIRRWVNGGKVSSKESTTCFECRPTVSNRLSILWEVDIAMLKAGILADRVAESSGALPSYISRSLESNQNFLSKYLSVVLVLSGCITQWIVALRRLSKEADGLSPSSAQTRPLVATWICSSLLMSAETVRIPASPLKRRNGSSTKKIDLSATIALRIV